MATLQTQLKIEISQYEEITSESMANIFLYYLEELLDERSIKQYYADSEFISIEHYIPKYEYGVFRILVDLALKYLDTSLSTLMRDFNIFYNNYISIVK